MDNAKSYFLSVMRYPVDDPRVQAWLAGTKAVDQEIGAMLQEVTGVDAQYWIGRDEYHLSVGGAILPASPIYEVRRLEQWEDSFTHGVFSDLALAEACREMCERLKEEHDETGAGYSVWRTALFHPAAAAE